MMIAKQIARHLLILCALSTGALAQNDIDSDLKKIERFLKSLDEQYVDEVITQDLVEEGIRRMLEELDPHSVYMDPETYQRANEPLKGKYKGVGIRFMMINDTMAILDVVDGTPAQAAGIQAGDRIVMINSDSIAGKGYSVTQVSKLIKQIEEDPVKLTVVRTFDPEGSHATVLVKRGDVEISSVPASFMLDQKTGYIKLERFSASSLDDFRDGLDELKKKKLKYLIVDLRGNGGGYLNVANAIADEFLEDRKLIVYTEGLHQDRRDTYASTGGRYTEGELYLLIDANSASASEILAGAIQDLDRGLIIGRRSYGKGLVQRTVEFSDGSAMRLTISRYYTPTGRSIQRPYEEGLEAYREEVRNRHLSGELLNSDSIQFTDSLIYFTPSKRKVYGGGGIIPDVFVPIDTSHYPEIIAKIRMRGLFDGFALRAANRFGDDYERLYANADKFLIEFKCDDALYMQFSQYLKKRGIDLDKEDWIAHKSSFEELIKVPLVRYVYGYEAYFLAQAFYDKDVKAARHEIESGTVKELGLR